MRNIGYFWAVETTNWGSPGYGHLVTGILWGLGQARITPCTTAQRVRSASYGNSFRVEVPSQSSFGELAERFARKVPAAW